LTSYADDEINSTENPLFLGGNTFEVIIKQQ